MDGIESKDAPDKTTSGDRESTTIRPAITPEERAALEMPIPIQQEPVTTDVSAPLDHYQFDDKQFGTGHIWIRANIRQETHAKVNQALLGDKGRRNLSDLIEDLLHEWLSRG